MALYGSLVTTAYIFAIISTGWSTIAQEISAEGSAISNHRQPRHLIQSKLCFKFGLCGGGHGQGNQGYGGYQGGYDGYQGGYGGQGGYPPINIGISQSQSSSSAGGSGYGPGYFPYNNYNNNQYNNKYPVGYNKPGNFGNGFGSYNNQFNGNFYGGRPQGGGYGFQGPFGNYFDDGYGDEKPVYENQEDYSRSAKSKD